ncbi:hypothetical protein J6590_031309 [Homalodisca vitripennis]|nr:hypothetical protein J6590_031309 [Homalodisca vitripennis]
MSICAVLLTKNGAERTLVANLSAASCFTIDHLQKEENHNRLQVADVVYVAIVCKYHVPIRYLPAPVFCTVFATPPLPLPALPNYPHSRTILFSYFLIVE